MSVLSYQTVAIVGFGLLGSSIARAVRRAMPSTQIICIDRDLAVCDAAMALGIADVAGQGADLAATADLVVLSMPVGAMGAAVQFLSPYLKDGAIVTDVGSVKQDVIDQVRPHLPPHVPFVPGHPMAGTEKSGPEAGFAELFDGKQWLLTPMDDTPLHALQMVQEFCESLGAVVKIMSPDIHDRTLAMTSHLPQLISYLMIRAADDLGRDLSHDVLATSANGFHGFARIAASDPVMWRDIYLTNREAVLQAIDRFDALLADLRAMVDEHDAAAMHEFFTRSRTRHLAHLAQRSGELRG